MLSKEAVRKILGIKENVPLEPTQMAKELVVTFYPYHNHKVSKNILDFADKFKTALVNLGVKVVPYEKTLVYPSLSRIFKIFSYVLIGKIPMGVKIGKKIKKGITIVALGEGKTGKLPMDRTLGFAQNSVITVLDMPEGIDTDTEFHRHFDTAMNLFAYHMTNIAIIVSDKKWIPYNFNASHPIYHIDGNFEEHILKGIIPKISAPIKPPKLNEFEILKEKFDPFDAEHKDIVEDFIQSGSILEKTGLYPPGKLLQQLPFRNDFYKWIGKIHLDHRNGMSYGFLARQMPTKPADVYDSQSIEEKPVEYNIESDFCRYKNKNFIILDIDGNKLAVSIPDVWVLTQKSGSKKTGMDPKKDLIKIGLIDGKMLMQVPEGLEVTPDYKPSFDTKVILAHAVGNGIISSVLKHLDPESEFSKNLEEKGMAIAHWHGYINPSAVPEGWHIHGNGNTQVACSTPQSAIYALSGKINAFIKSLEKKEKYTGDIHIEPHHGTNICFSSLKELGLFLIHRPDVSKLGNYYLNLYHSKI